MKFVVHKLLLLLILLAHESHSETVRVAVASNFIQPMKALVEAFSDATPHQVRASYGSSGKIYAQIINGAPFDLFLSADQHKPLRLIQQDYAKAGHRFTYAHGRLALCEKTQQSDTDSIQESLSSRLKAGDFNRLALANPKLAPYGKASLDVLNTLGVTSAVRPKLIKGENIAQSFQFVITGNADMGFVALSQTLAATASQLNCWHIPIHYYQPIKQDAVLLNSSIQRSASQAFFQFLQSEASKKIIRRFGYDI